MPKTALLIVDPQKDFCPGGALPVASGDAIMEPLNEILLHAADCGWTILVSRDWHPRQTSHFAEFGGPWPVHCVQDTPGAEFHSSLKIDVTMGDVIISKAMQADEDGYSPLCDNAFVPDGRTLAQYLKDEDIDTLYICGLATDYCVLAAVLDALKLPFIKKVYLLTDAIGAVNIKPGDGYRAIADMLDAGAILTTTIEVVNAPKPAEEVIDSRGHDVGFADDDFEDDNFDGEDFADDEFDEEDDGFEDDDFDEED